MAKAHYPWALSAGQSETSCSHSILSHPVKPFLQPSLCPWRSSRWTDNRILRHKEDSQQQAPASYLILTLSHVGPQFLNNRLVTLLKHFFSNFGFILRPGVLLKPKSQKEWLVNRQKSNLGLWVITKHYKYNTVRSYDQILLDMNCHTTYNHNGSRPGTQCGRETGHTTLKTKPGHVPRDGASVDKGEKKY